MTKKQALEIAYELTDGHLVTTEGVHRIAAALFDAQSHVFAELAKAIPPFADIVDDLRAQAEELRKGNVK